MTVPSSITAVVRHRRLAVLAGALAVFLAFFNLTNYPLPWYDEGSHLHVPKTLVERGQYADYSSEGFRYYGPTIGVGPTVMLPIAAVFQVFGVGLFQARAVMAVYLLGALVAFWFLARSLGAAGGSAAERLAWAATALLLGTRGVALLEYGRQVLGEVPAFFFTAAGLALWLSAWEHASWRRLIGVGGLLGLAVVTKSQFFIVIAPALAAGWALNLVYYRAAPQRVFLVPGILVGLLFAVWQVTVIVFLGPGAVAENLSLYREATASAATVFSPDLMERGLRELLSLKVYLGWLIPVLLYGLALAVPRMREAQRWSVIVLLIGVNLVWYVVASVSWIRYAFLGLALSGLLAARFFADLTGGLQFDRRGLWAAFQQKADDWPGRALRAALLGWFAVMAVVPLAQSALPIVRPPFNAPLAMADYMKANVPETALVETWEPEMGFLTDHNYHLPPQVLLYRSVSYVWAGGPPPSDGYTFIQDARPEYVLAGQFSKYVAFYPVEWLSDYRVMTEIGAYTLYKHR
jgi:hypothetical protein